jgi:hypothetical protein
MRRVTLTLSAAVAGVLLLAGCGTHLAGTSAASCGSGASPTASDAGGVRIVGAPGCQVFEVTNSGPEALTYTITYSWVSASGEALSLSKRDVVSVEPGRTVERTVVSEATASERSSVHLEIVKVRSVPTAEAPSEKGPCPAAGARVYADRTDAAMGLRVAGLHLVNCGTRPYRLDGYPLLRIFDERHEPVGGVRILHGGDSISTGTGAEGKPQPLVLRPGDSAHAGLVWRNTTGLADLVNAPYVQVVARPGAPAVMVTPELDLGTTGKLAVGPWKADPANRPSSAPVYTP